MTPREQELIERAFAEGLLSQAEVQAAQGLAAQGLAGGLLAALSARLEPARRAQLSAMWEALRVLGPWQLGARLPDGLELVEKLGAGGMGEVFLARGPNGERCAVKALDRDAHPLLAERFTREGEAQARVDGHPHVLRVRSAGQHAGRAFLVMDYAGGGDLKERLKSGPLATAEVVSLGGQLADALAHAHAQGVLHRDLKPANVLLDAEGRAMLADFGLAGLEGAETLTQTGTSLGTPGYMAPEQVDSKRGSIGPATDVYGLGALLFHLACGRAPFSATSRVGLITRLLTEPAPKLRALRPDAPARLEAVLERCLQKDPAARYPTMRDLQQALCEVEAGTGPGPGRGRAWVLGGVSALACVALIGTALRVGSGAGAGAGVGASLATPTPSQVAGEGEGDAGASPTQTRPALRGAALWQPQAEPLLYRLRYDRRRFVTADESVLLRIEAYFSLRCAPGTQGQLRSELEITRMLVDFRGAELGQQRYDTEHPHGHSALRALDAGIGAGLEGRIEAKSGLIELEAPGVDELREGVLAALKKTRTGALDTLAKDAGLPPLREILAGFMSAEFLNRCLAALTLACGPEALPWREEGDARTLGTRGPAPLPLLDKGKLPAKVELAGELAFAEGRCKRAWVEQQIEGAWRRSYRCELELNPRK